MTAPWMLALEDALAADETGDELATALVVIASVAGERVRIDEERRRAATRRSLLLLTAGGDPTRGLDLNGRAVTALAEELRDADRQIMLEEAMHELAPAASGLPHVSEAVHALIHAPDIAWRAYACSLLAEELGAEDD
jgi:hypothetical protein